jgi:branched-chain amino acid transport system substrate-binding protein
MKRAPISYLAALGVLTSLSLPASGQTEPLRVGVIAPEDGAFAMLGDQVRLAIDVFASRSDDPFGGAGNVEIVPAPENCEDEEGADAATSMVEAGVDAVIGLFCVETISAAMPILAESNIPAITVSVRAEIAIEDAISREWPLFRLAPASDEEAPRIAQIIAERWAGVPFALIDDGTIYGRDLVETVRLELETIGISPSFVDNYRPAEELQFGLVRRLANAGVTHVFVGGDRSDVAVIARDAAMAGFDMTFMGGDAMLAADGEAPLPDGIYAVTASREQNHELRRDTVAAIERRLAEAGLADIRAEDGYYLPTFAAAEILAEAKAQAQGAGAVLARTLRHERFETVLGPVRFGSDQASDGDPYHLTVSRGGRLVAVSAETPAPSGDPAPGAGQ